MTFLPTASCLLLLALHLVAEVNGIAWLRAVTKPLASAAFLWGAWVWGAWDGGLAGQLVVAGLALSWVGDVSLLWRTKRGLLVGLVAFLLAHVAYIGAFVSLGVSVVGFVVAAPVLAVVAARVYRWLSPHLGKLRPWVLAYMVAISLMLGAALSAVFAGSNPARAIVAISALAFYCSDIAVARDRFVAPGADNRLMGLPLYYLGQLGFAAYIAGA